MIAKVMVNHGNIIALHVVGRFYYGVYEQNTDEVGACADSVYQAVFSPSPKRPGDEASYKS